MNKQKKYQNLLWQIESECEKWKLLKKQNFNLQKIVEKSGFYKNTKSKYLDGFWVEKKVGNNSFVFKKGKKLFVPVLQFVEKNSSLSVEKGNKIVFRDFDENEDLMESMGLENFILTQGQKTGLPIYVVDNHNWVFYCWAEFLRLVPLEGGRKIFSQESQEPPNSLFKEEQLHLPLLIHIDAHKDEGEYFLNKKTKQLDLSEIKEITKKIKVSNYIFAAIQSGLIQPDFLSITELQDFLNFEKKFKLLKKESQNIILNVDLDFFDSEMSLISLEEKVRLIGYFASRADLITFATSPGFINQDLAIEITKIFLKYL